MLWVILKRYHFSQLPPGGKKWLRPQEWSLVSTPETWPLPATPYTTALTAHCSGISLSFYGKPRRETRAPSYEAVERENMKSVYAKVLSKSLAHSRHPRSIPELRQELSTISQYFHIYPKVISIYHVPGSLQITDGKTMNQSLCFHSRRRTENIQITTHCLWK